MSADVYYANGLRNIIPYLSKRSSYAKGRWVGLPLLTVLTKEFRKQGPDEYLKGIKSGRYKIRRGDRFLEVQDVLELPIEHKDIIGMTTHNHEPPVKQWCTSIEEENSIVEGKIGGIDIVYEDDELLVVNKPSGIPVHPTGQYYLNTLTEILKKHGKLVSPCYRLDKTTSGLLIMAKNQIIASKLQEKIRVHDMTKLYLARVEGQFPKILEVPTDLILTQEMILERIMTPALKSSVDSDIFTLELKKQFPAGLSPSREAKTDFYPVKYIPDLDQSIVLCKPLTGRTHQIRIHLARLGFPIVNDHFYNLRHSKYPKRSRFLLELASWEKSGLPPSTLKEKFDQLEEELREYQNSSSMQRNDEVCEICGSDLSSPIKLNELELYLHAWRYSDNENNFNFVTEIPKWIE
ncbi:hypothetical protein Kpol_1060p49 [Vanderwaltozyma polyspora DSM 70294]|uniref:Pseudouridine synthase RsuA/RluA-like domain-containing protein n=1 Tax=Vanderwaltozyma polyspora (strain ATCC 22028 / DSM 70294 / BCRC 21397 / CBS 2163 / NBRC 10782 / NRRL Y-8283 / UCD 57-17) TaxID=436907 RepID=A7TK47_VANPO|nr:uncharacterized protein Kpol_1060p49 [Vanderwaltozyma polyspora DSM 70294]EDO17393.1 hypothetical protein Kpol_1060p49 [Vanderwaltozyma polyspora DSM 70294]